MANDSCDSSPAPSGPVLPGTRMVHCVKFGKEMPGLDRVPWKGELGKRVYEHVSKEAWKLWIEYSKMLMNEYRLNPLDPTPKRSWKSRWSSSSSAKAPNSPKATSHPKPRADPQRSSRHSSGRPNQLRKRPIIFVERGTARLTAFLAACVVKPPHHRMFHGQPRQDGEP